MKIRTRSARYVITLHGGRWRWVTLHNDGWVRGPFEIRRVRRIRG